MKNCCCGCCSTRTGAIIIAVLGLIGGISGFASCIFNITVVRNTVQDPVRNETSTSGDENEDSSNENDDMDNALALNVQLIFSYIGLALAVVSLIVNCLLLYGAIKDKVNFCKPWLYYNFVMLIVGFIACAYVANRLYARQGVDAAFIAIPIFGICIFLHVYIISVVGNYTLHVRAKDEDEKDPNTIAA